MKLSVSVMRDVGVGDGENPLKKVKLAVDDKEDNGDDEQKHLIHLAWEHYRNYLDGAEDSTVCGSRTDISVDAEVDSEHGSSGEVGMGGEIDELIELLQILEKLTDIDSPSHNEVPSNVSLTPVPTTIAILQMIPILKSVACTILADEAIAQLIRAISSNASGISLSTNNDQSGVAVISSMGDTISAAISINDDTSSEQQLYDQILKYLLTALASFPENAAAISMTTNFLRMKVAPPAISLSSVSLSSSTLASWYLRAAERANQIRATAIHLLSQEEDKVSSECKEWIELLLLNQVTGVELLSSPPNKDEHNHDPPADEMSNTDNDSERIEEWSASSVEGTARFMAAMLLSMAGQHDLARQEVQLLGLSHRLSPRVWEESRKLITQPSSSSSSRSTASLLENRKQVPTNITRVVRIPSSYQGPSGVLPSYLYERLCALFHPKSTYWTESDYANRGYYSYFMDLPPPNSNHNQRSNKSNLIEDVVCNHLLPLVLRYLKETNSNNTQIDDIVGYEWWVHTRPIAANLGHNLHFDTDEAILMQEKCISHPIISSVLYLSGQENGSGVTVVLDQTPDSSTNADRAWCSGPINNTFMVFDGRLLHGVLPCMGTEHENEASSAIGGMNTPSDQTDLMEHLKSLVKGESTESHESPKSSSPNRLTLMVGFWTRRVPDRLKTKPKVYGPCGPLPSSKEAAWVREIYSGYDDTSFASLPRDFTQPENYQQEEGTTPKEMLESVPLLSVTPAWEDVTSFDSVLDRRRPGLQIPRSIDHRFFVMNAPHCFRESLFEKDEFLDSDEVDA